MDHLDTDTLPGEQAPDRRGCFRLGDHPPNRGVTGRVKLTCGILEEIIGSAKIGLESTVLVEMLFEP